MKIIATAVLLVLAFLLGCSSSSEEGGADGSRFGGLAQASEHTTHSRNASKELDKETRQILQETGLNLAEPDQLAEYMLRIYNQRSMYYRNGPLEVWQMEGLRFIPFQELNQEAQAHFNRGGRYYTRPVNLGGRTNVPAIVILEVPDVFPPGLMPTIIIVSCFPGGSHGWVREGTQTRDGGVPRHEACSMIAQ